MEHTQTPAADRLVTFPNPRPGRPFSIEIVCPEFTSVCPVTGQPDFGTVTFTYTPAELCVELKSLKLYLQRFRNQGIFYEAVTNQILDDFVAACRPVRCVVVSRWTPRGGITTNVTCEYGET
ncbi:MAG: preQ(1) synthase [Gemmataceae bacterium]|nr:preQ(1) synthase [Gemmataceae bacterium]